jgi:AbrB family looped-hinge helix DNA binding protein
MGKIIEKTTVDTKGRVMIPTSIRKRWGIKEGVVILFEEKNTEILLKLERKKGVRLKDLCGLSPKRTGEPKWITPEEIKSIWE